MMHTAASDVLLNQSPQLFMLLVDLTVKGSLVLLAAFVIARLARRRSAPLRHLVWSVAVICLLTLPLFNALLPAVPLTFLPVPPGIEAIMAQNGGGIEIIESESAVLRELSGAIPAMKGLDRSLTQIPARSNPPFPVNPHWTFWILLVWLSGFLYRASGFCIALFNSSLLIRKARKVDESYASLLSILSKKACISGKVEVRVDDSLQSPCSFGLLKKVILLPESFADWKTTELRSVLVHELAHLKRKDSLTELLARLALCFFWFNPLVWLAVKRKFVEMENSCDDSVLREGIRPSEYAGHLINLIENNQRLRKHVPSTAFSRRKQLFTRLHYILGSETNRSGEKSRIAFSLAAVSIGCAAFLAAVQPWSGETFSFKSDYNKAAELYRDKDFERAAYVLKKVVTLRPEDGKSWRWLGCAYRYLGKYELALAAYNRSIDSGYCEKYALFLIGCCYARMRENDLALMFLRRSLEKGITYPEFESYRGNFRLIENDPSYQALIGELLPDRLPG